MSILPKPRMNAIRRNRIIKPDAQDSVGEVWVPRRNGASGNGGAAVNGMPTGTATPSAPSADLVHLFTDFCRVRKLDRGKNSQGGGQSATESARKISFPYYRTDTQIRNQVPRDAIIRIQKTLWAAETDYAAGDVVQGEALSPYWYIAVAAGASGTTPPVWTTPAKGFDAGNWKRLTAFRTGDTIRVGAVRYRATVGGTSGGSEPVWPVTALGTVVDGGVTWQLCESVLDGAVVWQAGGRLNEYQAITDLSDGTYAALDGVICTKVEYQ